MSGLTGGRLISGRVPTYIMTATKIRVRAKQEECGEEFRNTRSASRRSVLAAAWTRAGVQRDERKPVGQKRRSPLVTEEQVAAQDRDRWQVAPRTALAFPKSSDSRHAVSFSRGRSQGPQRSVGVSRRSPGGSVGRTSGGARILLVEDISSKSCLFKSVDIVYRFDPLRRRAAIVILERMQYARQLRFAARRP
jgi:hypothetical protein